MTGLRGRYPSSTKGFVRPHVRRPARRATAAAATAVAAVVVTVVALAGGLGASLRPTSPNACAESAPSLRVSAAPEIAPVVSSVVAKLNASVVTSRSSVAAGLKDPHPSCPVAVVASSPPADVINALAAGRVEPPDVWIPDSSLWLTRADIDKVASATNVTSIASSPLVLALTAPAARKLRPDGSRPDVDDLVRATGAKTPLALRLSNERLSPERVGAVVALSAATADRPDRRAALTSLLRGAPVAQAPGKILQSLSGDRLVTVPAPEQAVWALRRGPSPKPLVAVYPGAVAFDYPYAVLSPDPEKVDLADQLFGLLRGQRGQRALQDAGFRDVAGVAGKALAVAGRALDGVPGLDPSHRESLRPLSSASLRQAERTVAAVNLDARLLAVLDVSGSMAWPMSGPGGSGPSRLRIAADAAARGLSLYPDSTQVGLWAFSKDLSRRGSRDLTGESSRDLTGESDYRSIGAVSQLGGADDGRARLRWALTQLRPVPDGDTALYATTLAAVRAMRRDWAPGKVNAVVLLSDGKDTDTQGPSLSELLRTLRSVKSSANPVPIITIAFGPDSDANTLAAISAASGGASYTASSPDQVRQVFLDAVGQRACRPHCSAS